MLRGIAVTLAALGVVTAGCGGGPEPPPPSVPEATTQPQQSATEQQAATTPGGCRAVQAPRPRTPPRERKPAQPLTPGNWSLRLKTNCGAFTIALDPKTAPNASASLIALARAHYFDDTVFHRIAPGFVIQGGDPSASGNGGPGYKTVDGPPRNARYTHGVVAMAKTEAERAGTGGSQFFVVTGRDARLPPDYAVVGRVTKGLAVVDKIGRLGDQNQQRPSRW